jgi:hypothetical protein
VNDELVHVSCYICVAETGDAIAAGFGGAECEAEEGVIVGANDGEVIGHFVRGFWGFRSEGQRWV